MLRRGREILRVLRVNNSQFSGRLVVEVERKNKARLLIVLSAGLVILLILGLSVILQQPLYVTQSYLTTTYNSPYANQYWKSARFNNTLGKELAFFNFALRYQNQSIGPVLMTLEYGPEPVESIHLDSARFTFTSDGPFSFPDIGIRVATNGLTPTHVSRTDNEQKVILDYENLGFYGTGTETFDLWFGINVVTASSGMNHWVSLTVDLTGHNPQPFTVRAILFGRSQISDRGPAERPPICSRPDILMKLAQGPASDLANLKGERLPHRSGALES